MNRKIVKILRKLGIPASLEGYRYLKTALEFSLSDEAIVFQITNRLYPAIAKVYGTTASRVERAIRHAIEVGWDRGNIDIQDSLFGYTVSRKSHRPTNSEFIAAVAEQIRLEESEND